MDVLTRYLLFKIIYRHGQINRYQLWKKLSQLGFSIQLSVLYPRIKIEEQAKNLVSTKIDMKDRSERGGKSHNGWWKGLRPQNQLMYSITAQGIKEMLNLEHKIQIALSGTLFGKEV